METTKPIISVNPAGGYILTCSDGTLQSLSNLDVLWLRLGFTSLYQLDAKYNKLDTRG